MKQVKIFRYIIYILLIFVTYLNIFTFISLVNCNVFCLFEYSLLDSDNRTYSKHCSVLPSSSLCYLCVSVLVSRLQCRFVQSYYIALPIELLKWQATFQANCIVCCRYGRLNVLRWLLWEAESRENMPALEKVANTTLALHYAAARGCLDCVRLLVDSTTELR